MKKTDIFINEKHVGFNPLQFGYHDCDPGYKTDYVFRPFWLIHYVISGSGTLELKGQHYSVEAGSMFIVPPYEYSSYQADTTHPWRYIWIGFEDNLNQLPGTFNTPVFHLPGAGAIFTEMRTCKQLENGRGAFLIGQLWKLVSLALESRRDAGKTDYVQKAILIMETEYMNPLSIEEIAGRLNLVRSYFSTLFQRQIGVTPVQYLINLRLERAAALMVQHHILPSAAAAAVGYTDMSHFSKSFKQKYGKSPRNYVKAARK